MEPRADAGSVASIAAPALAAAALAVALIAQFAITEGWGARGWLGFVPAAALLAAAAFVERRTARREVVSPPIEPSRRQELLLVAAIAGIAAFFRLYRFYDFPPGIWFDEGVNALDAIAILEDDHFTIWRETVGGRPTLYLYLLAGSFQVFGSTLFALRIVPVVAGLAAVVAFYLLARELIGVVPALCATALLAVSRWATTFSRISWEASLVPLFEIVAVFLVVRALETRSRTLFALAGAALAGGLYTYVAFRVVPVVMLMLLLYVAASQWALIRRNLAGLVVYGAAFAVVVAPLAVFGATHRDEVLARSREVNVFQEIEGAGSYEPLRSNLEAAVKMQNIAGDRNPRHNIAGEPMLDEVTAALFVLGVVAAIVSARRWRSGWLLAWYGLALAPAVLTVTGENPSGIRAIAAIPPLYLLAGLGIAALYRAFSASWAGVVAFGALAPALIVLSGGINYFDLFERQATDRRTYVEFEAPSLEVARIIEERGGADIVRVSPDFDAHPGVVALGEDREWGTYIAARDLIFPNDGRDALLVADPRQMAVVDQLRTLYPNLSVETDVDPFGVSYFSLVRIPAEDIADLRRLPMSVAGAATGADRLDHAWTLDDVAGGPREVTWDGYIWSNGYPGDMDLSVAAPGQVRIEAGGDMAEGNGSAALRVLLPYGEHAVRVTARIEGPGAVGGEIRRDGGTPQPLADELYGRAIGGHGFLALLRRSDQFSAEVAGTARVPVASPVVPLIGKAIEYQGMLEVTEGGTYGFSLEGLDSAQLFVDGALVVDNGGTHTHQRAEGEVALTAGAHEVAVQFISTRHPSWSLWWRPPGGEWSPMDGREFRPPEDPFMQEAVVALEPDESWGPGGIRAIPGFDGVTGIGRLPDGTIVVTSRRELAFLDASGNVARTVDIDAGEIADIAVTADGRIVVGDRASNDLLILDAEGRLARRVEEPFLSVGGVWVSGETAFVTSPVGGFVYAVSLSDGTASVLPMSEQGAELRPLQPADISITERGRVYVADFEGRTIIAGTQAAGERRFPGATGIGPQIPRLQLAAGYLLVSEPTTQRILFYDETGRPRGVYAFPPREPKSLPSALLATEDGLLYVTDLASGVVFRFRAAFAGQAVD